MNYNHHTTATANCQALNAEWQKIADSVSSPLIKRVTYYKYANRRIVAALKAIGEPAKAGAIYGCATYVRTGKRNGHEVITESNFCRQRLCQVCAWRRSAKFTAQMFPVVRNLTAQGYKPIFVTLTIKNVCAHEVRAALDVLLKGWNRLTKQRRIERLIKGFVRGLEITYNVQNDTYHPHIHALLFMAPDYANKALGGDYITHGELQEAWRNAARLDYEPIVGIQTVKPRKKTAGQGDMTEAAVIETIKYCYKVDERYINSDVVSTLLYSLQGRRLISFGGCVATERAKLQQGDIDDNLNDDNKKSDISEEYSVLYLFHPSGWHIIEGEEEHANI